MQQIFNNKVLILSFKQGFEKDQELLDQLGLKYKPIRFMDNGVAEMGYCIPLHTAQQMYSVLQVAKSLNQDRALLLLEDRTARLLDLASSSSRELGKFSSVGKYVAETHNSYVFDPLHEVYYVTEKEV